MTTIAPIPTPYRNSRARVLVLYRLCRKQGMTPEEAMQWVWDASQGLAEKSVEGSYLMACAEWDKTHATRYLGWIRNNQRTDRISLHWSGITP